jgi:cholest-4-en-3-one 26-monooxygenase
MTATERLDVDLTDPTLYRGGFPHELFTELRARGPVLRHAPARIEAFGGVDFEFWALVGHPELQQANRDWETFSALDGPTIIAGPRSRRGTMIVSKDPPDHTRMRRLISAGFTPRMIGTLEARIRARTDRILDAAAARGDIDFVADVAYQLPMHVIADIVGIPEDDRASVFAITDVLIRAWDPDQGIDQDTRQANEIELYQYANALSAQKRVDPADDVWSILATGELGELELDLFFMVLTIAGSETTRNALAQGLMTLVEHREQMDELRGDPSLLPGATEEILRWSSPVLCFGRTVTNDVDLGGRQLRAGERVGLFYPSANRDERAFDDPWRFDVTRDPNRHVGFGGGGPHYCLGASLARLEGQIAIRALLDRFRDIALAVEPRQLRWRRGLVLRGLTALPVRLMPAAR